jgi:hypothetical protein
LGLWTWCTILLKAGTPLPGLHHASLLSYTADDFLHHAIDSMEVGPKNATITRTTVGLGWEYSHFHAAPINTPPKFGFQICKLIKILHIFLAFQLARIASFLSNSMVAEISASACLIFHALSVFSFLHS